MPNDKKSDRNPLSPLGMFAKYRQWPKSIQVLLAIFVVAAIIAALYFVPSPSDLMGANDAASSKDAAISAEVVEAPETYDELLELFASDNVESVFIDSQKNTVWITLHDESEFNFTYTESFEAEIVEEVESAGIAISNAPLPSLSTIQKWIWPGLYGLLFNIGYEPGMKKDWTPLIVFTLVTVIFVVLTRLKNAGKIHGKRFGPIMRPAMGPSKATTGGKFDSVTIAVLPGDDPLTWEDVAGNEGAKDALSEILDILARPTLYRVFGAKIPKGILFHGPTGTGKSLVARVLASQAGIPVRIVSGSDFMQEFVGVGPKNVRALYEAAEKDADEYGASIVFIDEVDSIGRARSQGDNGEHRLTISAMLTELDGGVKRKNPVITIVATNRLEDLDPAFMRSGRFEEKVAFQNPGKAEREKILEIHTRKVPLADDVDFWRIAGITEGFNGADIEAIANKASIIVARRVDAELVEQLTEGLEEEEIFAMDALAVIHTALINAGEAITHDDLREAITQVIAGREKSVARPEHVKRITAYHEVAHALLAEAIADAGALKEITILARTGGSGGHVLNADEEDTFYLHQDAFWAELAVAYGGLVIEQMLLDGKHTSGPGGDTSNAKKHILRAIMQFGWSPLLGTMPISIDQLLADQTKADIESESKRMAAHAESLARYVILENLHVFETAVPFIMEKEIIRDEKMLETLVAGYKPTNIVEIEAELEGYTPMSDDEIQAILDKQSINLDAIAAAAKAPEQKELVEA